jgi:hypothetical protein
VLSSNTIYCSIIFANHIESTKLKKVGFEVFTAASKKMAVFWVVAPSSLVEFTDISEVLAASIIGAMSKPHARNQFEI